MTESAAALADVTRWIGIGIAVLGALLANPAATQHGAGAIVQVIVQLAPSLRDEAGRTLHPAAVAGLLGGMALMFATGLLVTV